MYLSWDRCRTIFHQKVCHCLQSNAGHWQACADFDLILNVNISMKSKGRRSVLKPNMTVQFGGDDDDGDANVSPHLVHNRCSDWVNQWSLWSGLWPNKPLRKNGQLGEDRTACPSGRRAFAYAWPNMSLVCTTCHSTGRCESSGAWTPCALGCGLRDWSRR